MENLSTEIDKVEKEIDTTKERYLREIKELEGRLKQNLEERGYRSISDWLEDVEKKKEKFEEEIGISGVFSRFVSVEKVSSLYLMVKAYTLLKDDEADKDIDVQFLEDAEKKAKEIIEKVKENERKMDENIKQLSEKSDQKIINMFKKKGEKVINTYFEPYSNLSKIDQEIDEFLESINENDNFEKLLKNVSNLLEINIEDLRFLLENSPDPIKNKELRKYIHTQVEIKEKLREKYYEKIWKSDLYKEIMDIFDNYQKLEKKLIEDANNITRKIEEVKENLEKQNNEMLKKLSETVLSEYSTPDGFANNDNPSFLGFNILFNRLWAEKRGNPDIIYSNMINELKKFREELREKLLNSPFREVKEYFKEETNISNTDELVGIFSKLRKKETLNDVVLEKYIFYKLCWFIYDSEDPLSVVDNLGEKEKELFFRMSKEYNNNLQETYKGYKKCYELERKVNDELYNISSRWLNKEMKYMENHKRALSANVRYLKKELEELKRRKYRKNYNK